jgi:hypothetical protein
MSFTKKNTLLLFQLIALLANAQFHPQVGIAGNNAIHKDSSIIKAWAASCKINRGYQDITNTSLGLTNTGDSSLVIGAADGSGVVSLGDGGEAILTFNSPIINGPGVDFCVFENAFLPGFLELATVSVSSDGINFFTFPPTSNTPTLTHVGPFDAVLDASKLNNLAGKYIANYGTPFDLQELAGNLQLNINAITHVKIKDVVGCLSCNNKTLDKNNQVINDPFTTPFASGGFDLDAVGVINQQPVNIVEFEKLNANIQFSQTHSTLIVKKLNQTPVQIELLNSIGLCVKRTFIEPSHEIKIEGLCAGLYFADFFYRSVKFSRKVIIY